jgi:hypothetical protein
MKPQQKRYQGASRYKQTNGRVWREISQSGDRSCDPSEDADHHDMNRFGAKRLHGAELAARDQMTTNAISDDVLRET